MTVIVSPKYQVVIPKEVRTSLGIKAGSKVEVVAKGRVASFIPVPELSDLQEDLKGKLTPTKLRNKKDRLQ